MPLHEDENEWKKLLVIFVTANGNVRKNSLEDFSNVNVNGKIAMKLEENDKIVGVKFLKGVHLNDSKTPLGSRIDRHENLGKGTMGWEPFRLLMNDNRFDEIPLILETADEELWAEEIKELFSLID